MAKAPEFTRLMALALLNYADDHGYFWANPTLVRGALFPFVDDSTTIRRSLAQLVEMGYLMIGKAPDGREGGFVVAFRKHQRVDRPKPSEIKPLISFDDASTIDLGLFVDDSTEDRKGTGKGREGIVIAPQGQSTDLETAAIYDAYPRKEARKDAIKAIEKVLASGAITSDALLAKTVAYANAVAQWPAKERQYVPHPATWFNRGSFADDPRVWVRTDPALSRQNSAPTEAEHEKRF